MPPAGILSANVQSYYVEEVSQLFPSSLVYVHEEEIWFNADRVFDSLSEEVTADDRKPLLLKDFSKSLAKVIQDLVSQRKLPPGGHHARPSATLRSADVVGKPVTLQSTSYFIFECCCEIFLGMVINGN